ncbi:Long chain acyl-CoA synthetase 1 [Camellia lanceoleosa]|uniref:Long chain acyl-CoA synthetase 1 n=1 Tax=Camellia lanceoleosa TaxID=1840588 RepID=A0ACC0F1U5_9ERIC|nr:Long chain acyl-CoA synthetase 1 [Camellia lanceoleosa]
MLGWREFNDGKGSRIGIYGSNCPQWIVAMEACSAHSLICVPLYDTLGSGAVNFIIGHAEIDFVFVQDKKVKEGKEHPSEPLPPQPFNICTIMYTSGTSGDPKGVILTHENIALNIRGVDLFLGQFEDKMMADDVYISFLPLAHVLDRMIEEYFFHNGASVGYYHGVKARLGGRIKCDRLTETYGLATVGFPDEMCMIGTVGSPFVYSELRLEEVPEMGYNPLGDPSCGEICVRGKTTFTGYNKNPELTAEAFQDGWFHTGDIGEMLPNGVVKIIDRKKNLIKLSQGEYVAVECLEKFYGITPIVEDIWVYGDSFRSMLVAVVVPHEENTIRWAYQNGHRGSLSELCFLKQLQDNVLLQLKSTAERTKLRGFEYIKGIMLEPQPFDAERDLVTATLKKKRDKLHKYYKLAFKFGTREFAKRINTLQKIICLYIPFVKDTWVSVEKYPRNRMLGWREFNDGKSLVRQGKEHPSEPLPPLPFNICTIMYTSGSSGERKVVILTHENIALKIRGVDFFVGQFEEKVKARLGGRIRLIVSGAAPLSSEVEEFLRVTSCAYVVQGHGLTETCGLATIGFPDEMCMIGTVGSPFVYSDIGEMLPNGVVKITDKMKNLIKLSQGEYVAVECLEKFYGITPIVEDIWVYGDSFRSMLVAVVVPNEENTIRCAYQNGHRGSLSKLCFLKQLQDTVLLQLKSTAERTKLRGFEYIKGIILEPQPFDAERDLVTATLKKKRDKLHKYYKVKIDELYQKLSGGRH